MNSPARRLTLLGLSAFLTLMVPTTAVRAGISKEELCCTLQEKHKTVLNGAWFDWLVPPGKPPEPYPPDDYYADCDAATLAVVVARINECVRTIAPYFVAKEDGNIEGLEEIPMGGDDGCGRPTEAPITVDNYEQRFAYLAEYVCSRMNYLVVQASTIGIHGASATGSGLTCADARASALEGFAGWPGAMPAHAGPIGRSEYYSQSPLAWSVTVTAAYGRITCDLTRFTMRGTARIYLRGAICDLPSTEYGEPLADLAWVEKGQYQYFEDAEVGVPYTSARAVGEDPPGSVAGCPPAALCNDVLGTGCCLENQVAIVRPNWKYNYTDCRPKCLACLQAGCSQVGTGASLRVTMGLGSTEGGYTTAGELVVKATRPNRQLSTPVALECELHRSIELLHDDGLPRQIKAPSCLADIVVVSPLEYNVCFYAAANAGVPDGSGFYQPTGKPYKSVTFANPDVSGTTYSRLRVTETNRVPETASERVTVNDYEWAADLGQWILSKCGGLRREFRTSTTNPSTGDREEEFTVQNADGTTVYREQNTYRRFPWGEEQILQVVDPEGAALTTEWSYYDSTGVLGYGRLAAVIQPTGAWERYVYDQYDHLVKRIAQFGDAPPTASESESRVTETTYGDSNPILTVVETLLGQEIGRRYQVNHALGETWDIECRVPGASWNDPANLVTITKNYLSGVFAGRVQAIKRPDGTLTLYAYSRDGDLETTEVKSGAPNGDDTGVLDGTGTVTVVDEGGNQQSETVYDILTGEVLSSTVTAEADSQGRPTKVVYLDGTYSTTVYACCGIESQTDREGITTSYEYDCLGRVEFTHRAGVTTQNVYDAEGRVTDTYRNGLHTNHSVYDVAGRLVASGDALERPTTYAETFDPDTGHQIRTTTNPDGSTRAEESYQDGSLFTVTGPAAHPLKYEYGVNADGRWTKEIKVGDGGSETEWVTTYTDLLGRAYKTVTAKAAETHSYYNDKSQLVKQDDPDGVTTLYAYNAKGESEFTATDMDQNGEMDLAGPDRVNRTVTAIVSAGDSGRGVAVRRTTTSVYGTDGSDAATVTSVHDTSLDGLHSWSTSYGLTTHTQTTYDRPNARRTLVSTAPDGTRTTEVYEQGRLQTSVTENPALNPEPSTLSSLTLTYDAQGRQSTATDARAIVTTTAYDDADQVTSTAVSAPDGLTQTTSYAYDPMGRRKTTTLPDGGVVNYEYHPTGELKSTWGARTYPVAYTYDAQGRMKTLKTWQNFAARTGEAVTTWNYDPASGQMISKRYVDGKGPDYDYTLAGRLKTRLWARFVVPPSGGPLTRLATTYAYNNAGELASIDYLDTTPDVTYTYDRRGRRTDTGTSFDGQPATFHVTYNDPGQATAETWTGGPLDGITVSRTFDSLQRLHILGASSLSSSFSYSATYDYDPASRMLTVTDDTGTHTATYAYVPNSSMVSTLTFKTAGEVKMTTTKTWDGLNRLLSISSLTSVGTPVSRHTYIYNQANQRTKATREDGAYWLYTYDSLGQVTSGKKYWPDGTPVAGCQFEYAYDDIGNRTSTKTNGREAMYHANLLNQYEQRTVPGAVDVTGSANAEATVTVNNQPVTRQGEYFYKALVANNSASALYPDIKTAAVKNDAGPAGEDVLTEQAGHEFLPQNPEHLEYDEDGNVKTDGRWGYHWDAENRLIVLETRPGAPCDTPTRLVYTYDDQSRTLRKDVFAENDGIWSLSRAVTIIWDDSNTLAQQHLPASTHRYYTWGSDPKYMSPTVRSAAALLWVCAGNTTRTHFTPACDANENITAYVGLASAPTAHYEFDPFGQASLLFDTGTLDMQPRYGSVPYDKEARLCCYRYRLYSPTHARWLSRDPIGVWGGPNTYMFLENAPISKREYLGLRSIGDDIAMRAQQPVNDDFSIETQDVLHAIPTWVCTDTKCRPGVASGITEVGKADFKNTYSCKETFSGSKKYCPNVTLTLKVTIKIVDVGRPSPMPPQPGEQPTAEWCAYNVSKDFVAYPSPGTLRTQDGYYIAKIHEQIHADNYKKSFRAWQARYSNPRTKVYESWSQCDNEWRGLKRTVDTEMKKLKTWTEPRHLDKAAWEDFYQRFGGMSSW